MLRDGNKYITRDVGEGEVRGLRRRGGEKGLGRREGEGIKFGRRGGERIGENGMALDP